jgi:hypothetical protein
LGQIGQLIPAQVGPWHLELQPFRHLRTQSLGGIDIHRFNDNFVISGFEADPFVKQRLVFFIGIFDKDVWNVPRLGK